jgi:hypothetical protein
MLQILVEISMICHIRLCELAEKAGFGHLVEKIKNAASGNSDFADGIRNFMKNYLGATSHSRYRFVNGVAVPTTRTQLNGCLEHMFRNTLEAGSTGISKITGENKKLTCSRIWLRLDLAARRMGLVQFDQMIYFTKLEMTRECGGLLVNQNEWWEYFSSEYLVTETVEDTSVSAYDADFRAGPDRANPRPTGNPVETVVRKWKRKIFQEAKAFHPEEGPGRLSSQSYLILSCVTHCCIPHRLANHDCNPEIACISPIPSLAALPRDV